MYSSLMGTFNIPPPVAYINAISSSTVIPHQFYLRTHYFLDTWTFPPTTDTLEEGEVGGMAYPISAREIAYQSIVNYADSNPIPISSEDVDDDVASI